VIDTVIHWKQDDDPPELRDAKRQLVELTVCPFSWPQIVAMPYYPYEADDDRPHVPLKGSPYSNENLNPCGDLIRRLYSFWPEVADKHAIDCEDSRFDWDGADIQQEDDLEHALEDIRRIERWIDKARSEYRTMMQPFARLLYASKTEYPKHFPSRHMSREQVRKESEGGKEDGSVFLSGIKRGLLNHLLWFTLEDWWKVLKVGHGKFRVSTRFPCVIGASFGSLTNVIEWEFNFGSGHVHAWPQREQDVERGSSTVTDWFSVGRYRRFACCDVVVIRRSGGARHRSAMSRYAATRG
jgi:hypothetical protein